MATSTEIKNSIDSLLEDNNVGQITASDLREIQYMMLKNIGGSEYYENSSTAPTTLTADTWIDIPNDFSQNIYTDSKPEFTTQPLMLNHKANLTELEAGTIIHARLHFNVITSVSNTLIKFRGVARSLSGAVITNLDFDDKEYKAAGSHSSTSHVMSLIIPAIAGGSISLQAYSDKDASIIWESVLIRVTQ